MNTKIAYVLILLLLILSNGLFAQGPPPDPSCPIPPCVPVNSNMWILAAAGLVYFTYFFYKRKKSNTMQA